MAKNQGVCALVTDGMVRDIDGLNAVGIPVFARGLSPNSPFKDGPGTIGLPISLGGVTVNAGDVVLGDQDGVVVVAREALESVLAALADDQGQRSQDGEGWCARGRKAAAGPASRCIAEKGVRFLGLMKRKVLYLSHATPEVYSIIRAAVPPGFELITLEQRQRRRAARERSRTARS